MNRKTLISCSIGNIFEWYDFMIYGGLSSILSQLFFPKEANHLIAIMLTLTIFAVGFLMRPIGSVFFGHIADKHGRKKALVISIMLIGFPSLFVAIMPTYKTIGVVAPIILLICRLLQGFAIGGELPSLLTYLAETSPISKRGYYCSYGSFIPAMGIFAAITIIAFLTHTISHKNMLLWGWRIPFIISVVLVLIGFYLRLTLLETPIFNNLNTHKFPLYQALKSYKIVMLQIFCIGIFVAIPYYSFNIFTVSYLTIFVHFKYHTALLISLLSTAFYIFMLPLFGHLVDAIGRRKLLIISGLGLIIFSYPIYMLLNTGKLAFALTAQFIFSLFLTPYCAAVPAFLPEQINAEVRCTVIGFPYGLAMAIFGGTAPVINVLLIKHFNSNVSPAYYIIFAAIIGGIITLTMKDLTNKEI